MVEAVARNAAACPDCGIPSIARHSSCVRHLKDLPMQGLAVKIKLLVGPLAVPKQALRKKDFFKERVPAVGLMPRFAEIVCAIDTSSTSGTY